MSNPAEIHPAPAGFAGPDTITAEAYARDYARSVQDPDAFWGEAARRLDWFRAPTVIRCRLSPSWSIPSSAASGASSAGRCPYPWLAT